MRIDLFLPPNNKYGVLQHMTKCFCDALNMEGAVCRVLEPTSPDPKQFLHELLSDKPDFTLSFNGLLPDNEGRFLCDVVKIPHICVLTQSPLLFTRLTNSPYNIITCPDRWAEELFKETGFPNVLFLPHAVEAALLTPPESARSFDAVMLASCIDYEEIHKRWMTNYPKRWCEAFEQTVEILFEKGGGNYFNTFMSQIGDPKEAANEGVNLLIALDSLEQYVCGRDRVELIRSLKGIPIDVFGEGEWKKYLENQENVTIHSPVPYEEALEIMKKSKVVLNSCYWTTNGGHERIFSGTLAGASIVTSSNPFLNAFDTFIYYDKDKDVKQAVQELLDNEEKRISGVKKAQELVLQSHTWESRAKLLLHELPRLIPG
ncbi:MAG: glycosyltransferase [Waddliaceae bacterium]